MKNVPAAVFILAGTLIAIPSCTSDRRPSSSGVGSPGGEPGAAALTLPSKSIVMLRLDPS